GSKVEDLRQQLIKILAHLEAFIDFPDEDIDPETGNALSARIQSLAEETSLLAATATAGRILREGVRTVICGAPNAGKSSLLNTLTGQDRAIVTEIPGTTRDTIEESIQLGGILLRLTDTAGIRDTDDVVEQAGIERSNRALSQAELVLEVLDGTQPPPESPPIPEGAIHLRLRNKADLPMNPSWNDASLSEFHPISCTTGEGLSALREQAQELLLQRKASSDLALVINARHQVALENTSKFLNTGREGLQRGVAPEFIAVDLRSALESLGEITGKTDIEEILGEIFQTFCIGK
ncbi:MAG: GTPase, partial [Verrucomicrobiota bacterium]